VKATVRTVRVIARLHDRSTGEVLEVTLRLAAHLGFAGGEKLTLSGPPIDHRVRRRHDESLERAVERVGRAQLERLEAAIDPELVVERDELTSAPWKVELDPAAAGVDRAPEMQL
jgi:hypothetical protein